MEFRAPPTPDGGPPSPGAVGDALADARVPWSVLAVLLYLSRLRSEAIVGRALAERFPDERSWQQFLNDPVTVEEVDGFAETVRDVRAGKQAALGLTPEAVATAAAPHLGRALDSVALTAERLGCAPEDLLVALMSS